MDPITLVVTALAAGAASGLTDTASSAVKDAYSALKALVAGRVRGRSAAELALSRHEEAPEQWRAALETELAAAGLDRDLELVAAARKLLQLTDAAPRPGKYTVDVRGAQGVQVGDHTRQDNVFNPAPGS